MMRSSLLAQLPSINQKYLDGSSQKDPTTHAGMLSHNPYTMERNKCLLLNHFSIFGSHFRDKAGDMFLVRVCVQIMA